MKNASSKSLTDYRFIQREVASQLQQLQCVNFLSPSTSDSVSVDRKTKLGDHAIVVGAVRNRLFVVVQLRFELKTTLNEKQLHDTFVLNKSIDSTMTETPIDSLI
jgi:hypothetical protein